MTLVLLLVDLRLGKWKVFVFNCGLCLYVFQFSGYFCLFHTNWDPSWFNLTTFCQHCNHTHLDVFTDYWDDLLRKLFWENFNCNCSLTDSGGISKSFFEAQQDSKDKDNWRFSFLIAFNSNLTDILRSYWLIRFSTFWIISTTFYTWYILFSLFVSMWYVSMFLSDIIRIELPTCIYMQFQGSYIQ